MSVNSCIYWHKLIDAMPRSAVSFCSFPPHSQPVGQFLDELPSLREVFFFFPLKKGKLQNVLVECCGQTKQKTEKFTVHRCTQVQFESRNWSQGVMADCILWLSGGSLLQTRTNHYIMQWREYFRGDSLKRSVWSLHVLSVCASCRWFSLFPQSRHKQVNPKLQ